MKNRFFILFILVTHIIYAEAAVVNGQCGINLTWSLDTKDSTLTIEGYGSMNLWYSVAYVPWYEYHSYITRITLPDELSNIGRNAFRDCENLMSINIPDSVSVIGEYAFSGCSKMLTVGFPNRLITIEQSAFQNCKSVTTLSLPNSVAKIDKHAFLNCEDLQSVTLPYNLPYIDEGVFMGCKSLPSINLPATIKGLGKDAFATCKQLNDVVLPDSLNYIGEFAFSGCKNLSTIIFPHNDVQIEKYAFLSCSKLKSIEIECGSIGQEAFSSCSVLDSISIGAGVHYMGAFLFRGCNSLSSVFWNAKSTNSCSSIFVYYESQYSSNNFDLRSHITSFIFGDSVIDIPEKLCSGLININSFNLPENVHNIENYAFDGCTGITSISIPRNVIKIGCGAFRGCSNLTSVTIGDSIKTIQDAAFKNSPIAELIVYATEPPSGGINSGIVNTSCILYVPEESVNVYANTIWWEDFASIRAIGSTSIVKFFDWDGTLLKSEVVNHGDAATAPTNTSREGYTFMGWDKDFSDVTTDLIVIALYKKNTYTITWKNEDGSTIDQTTVEYGVVPTHAEPSKQPTAEYTYTFAGWSPNVVAVTGDTTYIATYDSIKNCYTITWQNEDGSLIDQTTVEYGVVPTHAEPIKEATAEYTYTFAGWTPNVIAVTGDAMYQATFNATKNSYTITWQNEDGTQIDQTTVEYGVVPTHAEPTKEATAEYTYTFAGWTPEVIAVTGNATYRATFSAYKNKYLIVFEDEDSTELKSEQVKYGEMPIAPAAPSKPADSEFIYTFAGWTPEIVIVTKDATYTATYNATPVSEGFEDINAEDIAPQKVMIDNQIFILRGEKVYTLQGQEVR